MLILLASYGMLMYARIQVFFRCNQFLMQELYAYDMMSDTKSNAIMFSEKIHASSQHHPGIIPA